VSNTWLTMRYTAGSTLREHRKHLPRDVWIEGCQVFLDFVDNQAGCGCDVSPDAPPGTPSSESSVGLPELQVCCFLVFMFMFILRTASELVHLLELRPAQAKELRDSLQFTGGYPCKLSRVTCGLCLR
jgi:hypothetical protein